MRVVLYHFELQMAGVILLGAMLVCGVWLYVVRRRRERLLEQQQQQHLRPDDAFGPLGDSDELEDRNIGAGDNADKDAAADADGPARPPA